MAIKQASIHNLKLYYYTILIFLGSHLNFSSIAQKKPSVPFDAGESLRLDAEGDVPPITSPHTSSMGIMQKSLWCLVNQVIWCSFSSLSNEQVAYISRPPFLTSFEAFLKIFLWTHMLFFRLSMLNLQRDNGSRLQIPVEVHGTSSKTRSFVPVLILIQSVSSL